MDDFLPVFDFNECHELFVESSPQKVYHTFEQLDYSKSAVLNCLLFLRGIGSSKKLRSLFVPLFIDRPHRHLEGLIGRPWTRSGGVVRFNPEDFRSFNQPGYAKVVWEFTFESKGGGCLIKTETRILCTDASSRWKFRCYWFFVRPLSGIVRRLILNMIRDSL